MRLLPGRKRQVRFNLLVLTMLLVIFLAFLVSQRYAETPAFSGKYGQYGPALEFRLSPQDLKHLYSAADHSWTPVNLIKSRHGRVNAGLRRTPGFENDYEMEVSGLRYRLFKMDNRRRHLFRYFSRLRESGVPGAAPLQTMMKINGVTLGEYVMEEWFTEQLRNREGDYVIRLNADTLLFRRIRAELAAGRSESLNKHFSRQETAQYLVAYCRLFSQGPVDVGELFFQYRPTEKKFFPFFTFASIMVTDRKKQQFPAPSLPGDNPLKTVKPSDIRHAVEFTRGAPYQNAIAALL